MVKFTKLKPQGFALIQPGDATRLTSDPFAVGRVVDPQRQRARCHAGQLVQKLTLVFMFGRRAEIEECHRE